MPLHRLLLCYTPGLDVRRIESATTPYLKNLVDRYPSARVTTLPFTDHLPTILTGLLPNSHGYWGPRLCQESVKSGLATRVFEAIPSVISTSAQLVWHHLLSPLEGATLPPRRRRRFAWMSSKYVRSTLRSNPRQKLNGNDTIFTCLSDEPVRFSYEEDFHRLDEAIAAVASGDYRLEMLEVHCLDRVQHWWLHDGAKTEGFYRSFDKFIRELHEKCLDRGITLMLLSDHGMESVRHYIDLERALRVLDLDDKSFDVYVEPSKATFWFRDAAIRARIYEMLRGLNGGEILSQEDLLRFGLEASEKGYGELYFYVCPGYSIFPNDHDHALANLAYGLKDWQQRPRIWNPRHRGEHGHLPVHICEQGLLLLGSSGESLPPEVKLAEIAPIILSLLGQSPEINLQSGTR